MPDRREILGLGLGLAALAARPLAAQDGALEAVRRGEALAIMRHALAPGTGDPPEFTLGQCDTQRTLDARGRAQARATGAELRAAGLRFDRVLTSQWCRCRETAELLDVGPVEDAPPLNSFFAGRGDRTAQTRATLEILRAADLPVMVVSHQVNIRALTGQGTRSGEVLIARPGPNGLTVLGSLYQRP